MDEKDRLCLILFESSAQNYYNLSFLTKKNKENLEEKINQISINGGTDILSGLKMAVEVIKSQKQIMQKECLLFYYYQMDVIMILMM